MSISAQSFRPLLKTLARFLAWPAMFVAIFVSGISGSYVMTTLEAGLLSRWLAIGACLIAPPVLVALIFNSAPRPDNSKSTKQNDPLPLGGRSA